MPTRGVGKVRVFSLGTHEEKDLIYQYLGLEKSPGVEGYPYGYPHYPALDCYDEEYFKQLTVENSKMKQADDGEYYTFFYKARDGDRNEPFEHSGICARGAGDFEGEY